MTAEPLHESAMSARGRREIGDTGILVATVALDGSIFGWAAGADETAAVLDGYYAADGNLVSTADHYAGGRSEVMIGSWLRTVSDRSSVVIATQVGRHPDAPGLSRRSILGAVEASLERLRTDYVDFLSLDGDQAGTPLEESLETVDRLIREGKVRFLAASGYSPAQIGEVENLAAKLGSPGIHALLVDYNLMDRENYETAMQPIATRLGRGALAQLPLANGYLTGEVRSRDDAPKSMMYEGAQRHVGRRGTRILEAVATVAKELGSTSTQVAIAWLLVKPGIAAAVLRTNDAQHMLHGLESREIRLARHHVALLDRASAH
ncbi:MAG: aldo/keto reductase [Glaciihabitans sp.]|nr:aldo/keto reductase [Glaciihabitans sp.]